MSHPQTPAPATPRAGAGQTSPVSQVAGDTTPAAVHVEGHGSRGTRQWVLDLPMTRPVSLNDRGHWRVRAKRIREVRNDTAWCARAAKVPALVRIRVELLYVPVNAARRDPDNLFGTFKPAVDGLVDAGVVPDDTEVYVERLMPRILPPDRDPRRTSRLQLVITDLGGES